MISLPDDVRGALAVGWATVELDRAASQLSHLLEPGSGFREAPSSEILGAGCRVGAAATGSGLRIVLLEPATEGLLAGTLARSNEGWAVTWFQSTAATGGSAGSAAGAREGQPALSAARPGPFGDERLELGGPPTGPHRLRLEAVPSRP